MENTKYTFQVMAILENTILYFYLFIVHFSFKQVRFNSVANPYQIPFPGWDLQDSSAGY